jgi:hypothetical protein
MQEYGIAKQRERLIIAPHSGGLRAPRMAITVEA